MRSFNNCRWRIVWCVGDEVIMVNYWDVDMLLADMLDINLAFLIEDLLLNHSEGDVTPKKVVFDCR